MTHSNRRFSAALATVVVLIALAALGALYAGAALVPVNTRFTGPEAVDVIGRSQARGLIVAGPFLGTDRLAALLAAGVAVAEDLVPCQIPSGGCW